MLSCMDTLSGLVTSEPTVPAKGFRITSYNVCYTKLLREDVKLDEFSDEIESWILDELKAIGCDSAKSILDLSVEDLVKRTDLEEETIREVQSILKAEFE